jgi:two-component system, OmpR family, phosphate regulon response regulator PhoB
MMRPSILIVEDERPVLELLRVILSMDYQVMSAPNGEEAMILLEMVRPDLVLLDIGLGHGPSGLELCQLIRGDLSTRHLPILVLSGRGEELRSISLAAGANGFISKPYSPAYLLDRVAVLLGLEPEGRQHGQ